MPFQPRFSSVLVLAVVAAVGLSRVTTISLVTALPINVCVAFFLWIVYYSWIYPYYISPLSVIPTVPGSPLWGHIFTIATNEVGVPQRNWHETHGPIVRYFYAFGIERVSIADDEALHRILIKNPYNYPKPPPVKNWMSSILGEGVLLADGDVHAKQRKALAPAFSASSIKSLCPVFWRKGLKLADLWLQEIMLEDNPSKSFEVMEWSNRTTLDIIGAAAFGVELDSLSHPGNPLRKAYSSIFTYSLKSRIFHGLSTMFMVPLSANREMMQARETILKAAGEIVSDKYHESHSTDKDIMALIIKDNNKQADDEESELSFENLRDQVMSFLGAGHDTTATGVAWTLHLLSKHSDIQESLRAEFRQYIPALFDPVTRQDETQIMSADLDQLPYLNNVCRESLRYIPPIPHTSRRLVNMDQLGGYDMPGGTVIHIMANAIHRLPQFWGDTANTFDPERWNHLPRDQSAYAYMTFLHGPRGCIGRKFAETEMKVLLACLLSRFRFARAERVVDPEDCKMWRLVLKARDGITLNVSLLP